MTIKADQQLFAVALSSVEGVYGTPTLPQTVIKGSGWSQFESVRPGDMAWTVTWSVWVCLGGNSTNAELYLGDIMEPTVLALLPLMTIDSVELVDLTIAGGSVHMLQIRGYRELEINPVL